MVGVTWEVGQGWGAWQVRRVGQVGGPADGGGSQGVADVRLAYLRTTVTNAKGYVLRYPCLLSQLGAWCAGPLF